MPVVYSYNYNKGLKKEKNEDAINIAKNKQGHLISIICDGVSSHKNSSFSSNYIVNELSKKWKKTKFSDYENMKEWILKEISILNSSIIKKSLKTKEKMATTAVITIIFENILLVLNVGDSLTYGVTKDKNMIMLTKDDSFVGVLLDAGVISEEEAKVHPKRHTLTQALGINNEIDIHISETVLDDYEYILSCSDGLTTMLDKNKIVEIIFNEDLSSATKTLINEANIQGGLDNISIAIFKILRGVE